MINNLFLLAAFLLLLAYFLVFVLTQINWVVQCGWLVTIFCLVGIAFTLVVVPEQTSGVVLNYEKPTAVIKVLSSGWHFYNPLTERVHFLNLTQRRFTNTDFFALTNESTVVKLDFSVDWEVAPEQIIPYFEKQIQQHRKNLVNLAIQETLQNTLISLENSDIERDNLLSLLEQDLQQTFKEQAVTYKQLTLRQVELLAKPVAILPVTAENENTVLVVEEKSFSNTPVIAAEPEIITEPESAFLQASGETFSLPAQIALIYQNNWLRYQQHRGEGIYLGER